MHLDNLVFKHYSEKERKEVDFRSMIQNTWNEIPEKLKRNKIHDNLNYLSTIQDNQTTLLCKLSTNTGKDKINPNTQFFINIKYIIIPVTLKKKKKKEINK